MFDPRCERLAEVLTRYSCALKPGEKVFIEAIDVPMHFTNALIRATAACGAHPVVATKSQRVLRQLLQCGSAEQLDVIAEAEAGIMSQVDAYIGVRGSDNVSELKDVPADKVKLYESRVWKPVHLDIRVPKTRWVVLRWPTSSMAQLADTSTEAFEDFYFSVCTMDYARMSAAMQPLRELMEQTDRVRLVAPGTDLSFSLDGIPAICCDGHRNVPDGEVFSAPVRESVQGTIQFNAPTIYQSVSHENVRFRFRDGKIVEFMEFYDTSQAASAALLG